MKKNIRIAALTLSAALTASMGAAAADAREIRVAVAAGYVPVTYADEDGNPAGYDVAVLKAVDEELDDYTFTFELVEKEAMNVGVQVGTYQIGINNMFKTEERQKSYLFPENNVGYSTIGVVTREDEEDITSVQDVYDRELKIYPTLASGGIVSVVDAWNEAHPDAQLDLPTVPSLAPSDGLDSIRTGEYDAQITAIDVFHLLGDEAIAGLKISRPVDLIPTFPIINQSEEELRDAVDEALGTLRENGTLSEISEEYFGYDVFSIEVDK